MKEGESKSDTGTRINEKRDQRQTASQLDKKSLLKILQTAPEAYLILSPDLEIIEVTDAYLAATGCKREELLGRYVFNAFPDNPATPDANSVENLHNSLIKVLTTKRPHQMAIQHYDVPRQAALKRGTGARSTPLC